ncbi:anti-sigma factor [Streptosporangium sp. NBC_01755]|uniref:anti-sigma factor n=1 Tax=Streptosporangium sp. NBC_01755 TaxID=2975949 RepID=UPI002DDC5344|nr:anti-sigma factor [Streptosporangium sp. NBC_01755]WSD00019.1 anti-sigma factor [Streptosporangium sp. NBC_01755]
MNGIESGRDPHTLVGAYVLDAIDDHADRLLFEEHLGRCAECAQEVRGLAETAARLGQAEAADPPPALRERVMAQIDHVRQVPPAFAHVPGLRSGVRWWPRLATGLAAVGLAAAVSLGLVAIRLQDQLEQVQQRDRQISAVLAAPDARTLTATAQRGGTATVVLSRARGKLVFLTSGLPALPENGTYQMWQIGPAGIHSAGLMRPDALGHTPPVVTAPAATTTRLGVTVEPEGGSTRPTTQPLFLVDLPAI